MGPKYPWGPFWGNQVLQDLGGLPAHFLKLGALTELVKVGPLRGPFPCLAHRAQDVLHSLLHPGFLAENPE